MAEGAGEHPQKFWVFNHRKTGSHGYLAARIVAACRRHARFGSGVLDIGCGNGWLARDLVDAGFQVVGIEPSESGSRIAREVVPEAQFFTLGVYDDVCGIRDGYFEAVVSAEVIEHLYSPGAAVELAYRKLQDEGVFVVTTPYHGWLKNVLIAVTGKWDGHHQPWEDGSHIKFWSRVSLTAFLERHGFRVIEFIGVGRVPWLWKSMILVARKAQPSAMR